MYKLPPHEPGKIRISVVGDSISEGMLTTINEDLKKEGSKHYLINGCKMGQKGWPYELWKILESKNISDRFEILNFGFTRRFAAVPSDLVRYKNDPSEPDNTRGCNINSIFQSCDYLQAMKSQPNVVILMLGTNDLVHS